MENHQNQEAQRTSAAHPANNKPSGGSHRGGHRGGRGGHHRRPQTKKTTEEAVEQKSTEAAVPVQEDKNASPKQQQKSGDKSRSGRNRSRGGKGNANKDNEAQNHAQPQAGESKRRNKDSGAIDSSVTFQNDHALFGSADFLGDSSFLPVHEEHKPDPEAEKYAASILDAEGPLLFREEPVQAPNAETPDIEDNEEDNTPVEIVGIRFRPTGKVYFFDPGALKLKLGSYAVVETARGLEYGEVARANATVPQKQIVPPLRPVIRVATADDVRHFEENKKREDEAFRICQEKIASHGLDMKLVEAEYTFDNTKLLFYFTSAGRVDFRELVKDLAGVFRTRIELRQIGIRDEAKLLGGLGTCGRPLCCASVLADFVQVSIKMAKEQNLSLNSTKISGCCGRLMCCLRYEADTYEEEIRRTPSIGSLLKTPDGEGNVISNNPLRGTVRVRLGGEDDTIKEYHRDNVQVLKSAVSQKED